MKLLALVLVALAFLASAQSADEKVRYDNHSVYRLTPRNLKALEALKKLEEQPLTPYDFWGGVYAINHTIDVMVPPNKREDISKLFSLGIDAEITIQNVQQLIDIESARPETYLDTFGWDRYHTFDEINNWLRNLALNYDDKITLLQVGNTYQGRTMMGVRYDTSPWQTKKVVFIEANIHAREWITSATVTYILWQLITSVDPKVRNLANSYTWYFVPVANPDGFVHTHTNNRMWRKTRTPYSILCFGADPNRNWPYQWMQNGGASNNPCSDLYAGPTPLSEPATNSLADFITSVSDNMEAYISFHSYTQLLLIPYGHTAQPLDNYYELMEVGREALRALATRYGTQYTVGNVAEAIYVATGSSVDWVKHTFKTPLTYTYELRDLGQHGFLLPPEQIIPTGEETLDSLVEMFRQWKLRYPDHLSVNQTIVN